MSSVVRNITFDVRCGDLDGRSASELAIAPEQWRIRVLMATLLRALC